MIQNLPDKPSAALRLAIWNMQGKALWEYLERHQVDVALVQEAPENQSFAAFGRPTYTKRVRGVGIIDLSGRAQVGAGEVLCDGDVVAATSAALGVRLISMNASLSNRPKGYRGHGGHDGVMLQRLEDLEDVILQPGAVVLGGDFNTALRMKSLNKPERVFEKLTRYRLRNLLCDALCKSHDDLGCQMYTHKPTRRLKDNSWVIDHLYGSLNVVPRVQFAGVGDERVWTDGLSDHLPIFVDIALETR